MTSKRLASTAGPTAQAGPTTLISRATPGERIKRAEKAASIRAAERKMSQADLKVRAARPMIPAPIARSLLCTRGRPAPRRATARSSR